MIRVALVITLALTVTATASATWTPTHPGDPRACQYNRPAYCGDIAARLAFKAKYQRTQGRLFVGVLQCPSVDKFTYMCRWGSAAQGMRRTVVKFADKQMGWTAAVGAIG